MILLKIYLFQNFEFFFLNTYIKNCPKNAVNTTHIAQNTLIKIIGEFIRNKILNEIKSSKHFAVLADETAEIGGIEQFAIAIRYYRKETFEMCEEFIDFIPVKSTTGETLSETILEKLKIWGLEIKYLR